MVDSLQDYAVEIARLFPRQGRWREEDYFALPETNTIVELVHGTIIVSPSPDDKHQTAVEELFYMLKTYVDAQNLGRARVAPFDVRLGPNLIRQPDVFFVRQEHLDRIVGKYLSGAPDWVAEVISPGTRAADEQEKMVEYAQAGIPEYWLIDPKVRTVRVYALPEGETAYILAGTYTSGQIASSVALPGFEMAVDKLFAA